MKRVLSKLKEFRWWILVAMIGIAAGAMADLVLPNYLSKLVDLDPSINFGSALVSYGIRMVGVSILALLGAALGNYCASYVGSSFARDTRHEVFAKVQTFSQADLNKIGTASLITRNTNDVFQIQQLIMMYIRIFVRAPILFIGGIVMTYRKRPDLAFPLLISLPAIAFIVFLISKLIVPMFPMLQKKVDGVNRILREQISGIRVVRAFRTEDHEEERFDEVSLDFKKLSLKMGRRAMLMGPLLTIVMNFTIVAVLVLITKKTGQGILISKGTTIAVVQYISQIMFSLVMLSMMFIAYPRAEASAQRIAEVLEMEPTIKDLKNTKKGDPTYENTIEFRNVAFSFAGAERPTLDNINFISRKGETTALIGSTGSGKSTILQLILRFQDVTQGSILVDGVDIREMSQEDLRARIGYVPQKSQLFSGSIAHNLQFGKEEATVEEMNGAIKIAQATDFVSEKSGQLEHRVAQGGTNFSGGQKQRLSIARAVVRQPEIYLFDDSFSALDAETDLKLRTALKENTKEATQIIVAQRVSSIADADQILVLDNGRIVGKGTHDELMKNCEVYQEIAFSQFSDEEVAG